MRLFSAKKGNLIDLITSPLFVTIVALGLVGLTILNAVAQVGSSTTFEQKHYSADIALLVDTLYSFRKDINIHYKYTPPQTMAFNIEPHTVTAYTDKKENGNKFYYTQDNLYSNSYGEFPKGTQIVLFRNAQTIGAAKQAPTFETPTICEEQVFSIQGTIGTAEQITSTPTTIFGPTPLIMTQLTKGPSQLIIYTNGKPQTDTTACHIVKQLLQTGISFSSYTILPINSLLSFDEGTKQITKSKEPALLIKLQQEKTTNAIQTATHYAIREALQNE